MKVQNLAIIFVLIILPISIALSAYTEMQFTTLTTESKYDSKLINATNDALLAYQINSNYESESGIADKKIQIIEAAVSAFYNSLEMNMSLRGYDREVLQQYVPAIVFTMYDGLYIYSPYSNVSSETGEININAAEDTYGVKPYIYYSCRYTGTNYDVVITYSLDNYIKINGRIGTEYINDEGYLLSGVSYDSSKKEYSYNGITIGAEILQEKVPDENGELKKYMYIKENGTKYYWDQNKDEVFYYLNGTKNIKVSKAINAEKYQEYCDKITTNTSAIDFYKNAYNFTTKCKHLYKLHQIVANSAITYPTDNTDSIFTFGFTTGTTAYGTFLEDENSNFNKERKRVIKATIENNLTTAIANFNNYSGNSSYNYQMPVLEETEWELLYNNISIISFLQGLNLKTKVYNGHTVIVNDETNELVKDGNIYMANNGIYHSILHEDLKNELVGISVVGVLSTDFDAKTIDSGESYYYAREENPCYDCIIQQTAISKDYNGNIYEYLKTLKNKGGYDDILRAYYTALGRERYSMYRINR